jgi:hypothetical protein
MFPAWPNYRQAGRRGNQEGRMFFFEKKNQKTFDYVEPSGAQGGGWSVVPPDFFLSADRLNIIFLLLFFKKEDLLLLPRC